ncbi:DUF4381 domain-containing protein [Vibrio sp. BS-M-Sm-2]|uniref:DUF4381 domain-containing protein n=1 Tax=Vibrio sp. BS-M-Sm-2 TaxID=3241167 RepID=UPI0035585016
MSDNRVLLKGFIDPASTVDVSWLPTTIGWKATFVLILVWGAWKSFHLFHSYKANKYRRLAVKAISRIKQDTIDNQRQQQELRRINSLLKQVACCSFPGSKVAMLSGNEWGSSSLFLHRIRFLTERFYCNGSKISTSPHQIIAGPKVN